MEVIFRFILSFFVWTSAAIIVGGSYLIWGILKLFCKLLGKTFDKIDAEEENYNIYKGRKVRENRRVR